MRLFDTHSHLDDEQFDNDREEIIKKIWENDVKTVMEVGSSLETSLKAVNIANSHDFIYASVGIHPEFAENADDEDFQKIKTIAETEPKVKAIERSALIIIMMTPPRVNHSLIVFKTRF